MEQLERAEASDLRSLSRTSFALIGFLLYSFTKGSYKRKCWFYGLQKLSFSTEQICYQQQRPVIINSSDLLSSTDATFCSSFLGFYRLSMYSCWRSLVDIANARNDALVQKTQLLLRLFNSSKQTGSDGFWNRLL